MEYLNFIKSNGFVLSLSNPCAYPVSSGSLVPPALLVWREPPHLCGTVDFECLFFGAAIADAV